MNGTINGQPVWQTNGFLYFSIPASLNAVAGQPLYVAVQYYDTGYNKLGYQYDSTQGAFFSPEATAHSSLVNSNTFATSYFVMETPTLQKQENGGNDFRIYGTNGSVSIASVSIQKTPYNNATFQLALTTPWLTAYPTSTTDASTLKGKTFAGYQGWFSCPNDLNDQGWVHWSSTSPFTVLPGFPTWPDISAYPTNSQYAGATCKADNLLTQSGKQAYVYSSANPDVIAQHFSWMQQNNIDGVWVQRFLGSGNVPGTHPEWVLAGVRKSAPQYQRLWAIEYDVSELNNTNVVATIEADWQWLHDSAHILQDGNYMHNAGKPVVIVWGFECRQDLGYTPDTATTLINWLQNDPVYGGNYVVGGICNQYASDTADWIAHIKTYNGLQVWQPQNNALDHTTFTSWGIDWYPAAWAGHSLAGQEYWTNIYNIVAAGADRFFIGMYDEFGENTATIPISNDPPATTPAMLTSQGQPATWWLQLGGYGKQMMLNQIPLSATMPSSSSSP